MKTLFRRTSLALALTTTLVMTAQAQDLRISMYADITGLDPHDTSDNVSYSVQSGIFERLFQFDPQMKLEPWLATGYTSNDSATEFTLRCVKALPSRTVRLLMRKRSKRTLIVWLTRKKG